MQCHSQQTRIGIMRVNHGKLLCLCLTSLIAEALTFSPAAASTEATYSVGVAAVDVTPDYPIRLNGFGGRRTESEGITQPIWAKALAIGSDEDRPLVLITLDSLGIRLPMVDEVARRLKEKAGIERERLVVTFTHSHTTPKVNGASDTIFSTPIPPEHQAHIDRYTKELTDALVKVALEALADRKPSRLEWSVGEVKFAKNRRPQGGPVDHSLPMLVVRSAEGDAIRAIYVTYACHCVTLSNNKISGDWAGFAQEAIQRKNPGAVALVSIGCGSDSNPSSGVSGENIAVAAEQGGEIADEVQRLLKGALTPICGKLHASYAKIDLPLNKVPGREELETAAAKDDPAGFNAKFQLAKLDRGEPLLEKIDYPIQVLSLGDSLAMVFLGGEVCADYTLRLRNELDPTRVWLHGYSNDFCCYVPSERLLKEGGYGGGAEIVYFALPTTLQAGMEDKIVAEVHRQIPPQFGGKQAAKSTDAADAIAKLVDGLAVGTPAEYERIPEIWRVAIDAGKRNDTDELRKLLDLSVPKLNEPVADWQVVVCGGGIINGLSMNGVWPRMRIIELVQADPLLSRRCERMVELCIAIADDEAVRSGTRYDALRVLGAEEYARSGETLKKYLTSDDAELQMGAISGLSDMEPDAASEAILGAFSHYNESNQKLAIAALLRTDARREMLKNAVEAGQIPAAALTTEQAIKLRLR
jgi:hypothetical protein